MRLKIIQDEEGVKAEKAIITCWLVKSLSFIGERAKRASLLEARGDEVREMATDGCRRLHPLLS